MVDRNKVYEEFAFSFGGEPGKVLGPSMQVRLGRFERFFQDALGVVTANLAAAGRNAARKRLRAAETPWGQARMSGEYFGVRFRPYGRSAGREDSGTMIDSLQSWVDIEPGARGVSRNKHEGYFGWPREDLQPYFILQEEGFYSTGSFDPAATAASGTAKFKSGPRKFISGARSRLAGEQAVAKIDQSFYQGAWNEAVKQWREHGFKKDVGNYLDQRIGGRNRGRRTFVTFAAAPGSAEDVF